MGNAYYLNNPRLKGAGVKIPFTQENIDEILKCSHDPVYFIKTYMKIANVDAEKLIPFNLWDFQEDLILKYFKNRFVISKWPRQSGKSSCTVAFLLWYILFHSNAKCCILANKGITARDLLQRIKLAYEYLPFWLQQGVVVWNKGFIELENGSSIVAAATSASAVRGGTYNIIFLDEFAHIHENTAEEFFTSVYPTITSGTTTKVFIVSTPKGMNYFYKLWTRATQKISAYVPVEVNWWQVPGRDEAWKQQTINNTSKEQFEQEFGGDFLGSSNTLLSSITLKSLVPVPPIKSNEDGMDVYEDPYPDHVYYMTVDTSRGRGIDYSAFVVFDITEYPYKMVAKYRNNEVSTMLYPNIIYRVAQAYNECDVLVETNDAGGQVADILHYDLEYPNVAIISYKPKMDETLRVNRTILGVRTTKSVKRIGCANVKTLIETKKLLVSDIDTIAEFSTFIVKGTTATFEADIGHHDDLVMCHVLFAWFTTQSQFKELTNSDIRARLQEERQKQMEEDLLPFGFFSDGISDNEMEPAFNF